MIELKKINVIFNKSSKLENHVLEDMYLNVTEGEFITIIGGNGAGKSTLMNLMSGDVVANTGSIIIDGLDVTNMSTEKRSGLIARVFQDPMIGTCAELTIEENMSMAFMRGKRRGCAHSITKDLRSFFSDKLRCLDMGLENRLNDKVSGLSGGQRQALSLIMATIEGSKLLLLDEHTAALDPKIAKLIMDITAKLIRENNLTVLMITHSMHQALHYGSRTLMMQNGKIVRDILGPEREVLVPEDLIQYFAA